MDILPHLAQEFYLIAHIFRATLHPSGRGHPYVYQSWHIRKCKDSVAMQSVCSLAHIGSWTQLTQDADKQDKNQPNAKKETRGKERVFQRNCLLLEQQLWSNPGSHDISPQSKHSPLLDNSDKKVPIDSVPPPATVRVKASDNVSMLCQTHGHTLTPVPAADPLPMFKVIWPAPSKIAKACQILHLLLALLYT